MKKDCHQEEQPKYRWGDDRARDAVLLAVYDLSEGTAGKRVSTEHVREYVNSLGMMAMSDGEFARLRTEIFAKWKRH